MNKWEYRTIILNVKFKKNNTIKLVEEECNKLGDECWELVNFHQDVIDGLIYLIFKRPKEN